MDRKAAFRAATAPIPPTAIIPDPPRPTPEPWTIDTDAVRAATAEITARHRALARARRNWAPHMNADTVPPGYVVKGVSVLRDGDGNVKLVWTKTMRE